MSVKQSIGMLLLELGLDPRRFLNVFRLPFTIRDAFKFLRLGGRVDAFMPIVSDLNDEAGVAKGHYFNQDLYVARKIYENSPIKHIDVGSRIDGFVLACAAYRKIYVVDIRDLSGVQVPNIEFIQADMMSPLNSDLLSADSVSCLHALEHFGLGRYGDPINPNGHLEGLENIEKIVKPGGTLYLSFPITEKKEKVLFNAHRVFNYKSIPNWTPLANFELISFSYVDDNGDFHEDVDIKKSFQINSGCGVYIFRKKDK